MGREGHHLFSDGRQNMLNRRTKPRPNDSRFFAQFQFNGNDERGDAHNRSTTESDLLPQEADDDLQLDAFDLELLAQSDEVQNTSYQAPFTAVTGVGDFKTASTTTANRFQGFYNNKDVSQQVSPFFSSAKAQVTPLRGLESSSSELDLGSPSSPLTRLQPRKTAAPFQNGNHGGRESRPWPSSLGNQSEALSSSRLNSEFSLVDQDQQTNEGAPFKNIPISVRGIRLVSVNELPDRFRSIFPFPLFNAIQSKCFHPVYNGNDNVVLAAPTGSGKTVVMELAICRLLSSLNDERFKVVYQAPTKSLCAERFRDWNTKFWTLGLQCAELTGDTDHAQLKFVQNAQIIITTPEKWDSMTRKWKDHARLMQLVKLFLIDEVHILKETRGATLEAVVSRMKSFGSNVRFVALSATVPNSEDIATWLGKDATNQQIPAHREHFGEDFRPVKLQKFVYGYQSNGNDFAFDKMCNSKLPDVIGTHSSKKSIMIFCSTRNSAVATAKELARLWTMTNPPARLWKEPSKSIHVQNVDLKGTVTTGVAFHHAGLDPADRHVIETGFLEGQVSIICSTSTLAVGVNLPCHLVIIKNTVGWQEGGCKEYSDLEMMQMLGRAGRPQFDDSATAVILTRKERVNHYKKLVSGSESVESCLHLNLIDHLNAEIGLGTVTDIESAVRWLAGTFLFVRLRRNPTHYKLKEGANQQDEDEVLRQICKKDIKLLQETGLVSVEGKLRSTQFGDAMARYYVRFETMKTLLTLKPGATVSQILTVIAQAEEFREIRLKSGEKSLYKEINKANGIRSPVKVDIALPAHKISLLIQSELAGVEFPDGEQFQKHKFSFQQDKNFVFTHINRLIRCVIDCQICLEDSIAIRNALELARSFGARVWDNSPLQMKQIDQIGVVAVRKLAAAGITSIEALQLTEAHQIDMILSKNPPFGMKLLSRLGDFPKLRVAVKMAGKETKTGNPVKIRFKTEIAFMNEKVPTYFQKRPVYVCFLAETSDGHMIDFRRMSATKLQKGHEILLIAELKSADQYIKCYAMCDEIAGTLRYAELKPDIPASLFPASSDRKTADRPRMNMSRPRSNDIPKNKTRINREADAFDGDDLFDDFLSADQGTEWVVIDNECPSPPRKKSDDKIPRGHGNQEKKGTAQTGDEEEEPIRLANGRWACNHKCRDKTTCKHLCCREGLEKPPRASKKQSGAGNQKKSGLNQLTLSASINKRDALPLGTIADSLGEIEQVDATQLQAKQALGRKLNNAGQRRHADSSIWTQVQSTETDSFENATVEHPSSRQSDSFLHRRKSSSDYGDDSLNDLPSPSFLLCDEGSDLNGITNTENKNEKIAEKKSTVTDDTNVFPLEPSASYLDTEWIDVDEWLPFHSELDKLPPQTDGHEPEPTINHTGTGTAKQEIQSRYQSPNTPCRSSKPIPESNPEDSTLPLKTSSDSLSVGASHLNLDTPCGQKRKKPCPENEDQKENEDYSNTWKHEKRLKRTNSSPHPVDQGEVVEQVVSLDESKSTHDTHHPEGQTLPRPETVTSTDWEDIDPALLDEFKDIVNFF